MLTGTFIWIIIVIIFPPYVVHYAKIRLLTEAETLYRMCFTVILQGLECGSFNQNLEFD